MSDKLLRQDDVLEIINTMGCACRKYAPEICDKCILIKAIYALPPADTNASTSVESDKFLIQRTGYYVGNSVVWWRPKSMGYTTKLDEAGRYSAEEAWKITGHPTCEDRAWPEADILAVATLHVDSQYMPRAALSTQTPGVKPKEAG